MIDYLKGKLAEAQAKLDESKRQRDNWNVQMVDNNARCNLLREVIAELREKEKKRND